MAFADGTKLGGTGRAAGVAVLLEVLDNMECWHTGNGMKFNSGKYKVMPLGIANKNLCRKLGAHQLEMTEEGKNLGVFVDLQMTKNSQSEADLTKSTYPWRYFQEKGNVNAIIEASAATFSGIMYATLLIRGPKLKM